MLLLKTYFYLVLISVIYILILHTCKTSYRLFRFFLQEQLSHDPLVHEQVFSKEWTLGEEQACHKGMQENVDIKDRFEPHDVGSGTSSSR